MKSNLLNMVLVLSLTCLVCSGILAGAYVLTKDPISEAAERKSNEAIAKVLPEFSSTSEDDAMLGEVKYHYFKAEGPAGVVGYAVRSTVSGFGGPLTLMVGITPDGIVYNSCVLSHSETPGLGAKCETDEAFMAQWKGFDPSVKTLSVRKDGGDVDAITASTITSRAYALAVSNAVEVVRSLGSEAIDGSTGASVIIKEEPNDE